MDLLSTAHLAVLAATVAAAIALALLARRRPDAAWIRPFAWALAAVLVGCQAALWITRARAGTLSLTGDLPLHLTDAATFVGAAALVAPAPLLFELTYFWAFTGVAQALLTPDLNQPFPDYRWWIFVLAHAGVVVGAALLAFGLGRTPRPGAVPRVLLVTAGFALFVYVVNVLVDANYMYLRRPAPDSLLELMGPWPWYLAGAALIAAVAFWLLDLPFRGRRRRMEAH